MRYFLRIHYSIRVQMERSVDINIRIFHNLKIVVSIQVTIISAKIDTYY